MRFAVDAMLGTLAKWMRILGYDALYDPGLDDDGLVRVATEDGRVIVSRDRELCSRMPGSLHVTSTSLEEQLAIVIDAWPPDEATILTRCIECNRLLAGAGPEEARNHVPDGVLERHSEFWRCKECGRFYWRGTHWEKMEARARELIACRNSPH